ncbi:MAG: hypothetical protein HY901_17700 [Deltaproteobacteria bacterium]|nr:hypothetical protein [Deltaproteobacteria bacterium]
MRKVHVQPPSFPAVATDQLLQVKPGLRWQVMCGDAGHWRVGVYSPPETGADQCGELERHDCPEYFHLLSGRLTLVLHEAAGVRELALEPGHPVLVTVPHSGFCPDGPHSGAALVVERDSLSTEYRTPKEWREAT